MNLKIDGHSPIPIRLQLMEQLRHVIEGGGVPRDQALPSIRELAGFLGVNPNTVARVIDDLKRRGYVEARRGRRIRGPGAAGPARPHLREAFLQDAVIRAAALGMTVDDLSVGVLSLAGVRPAAIRGAVEVLLVECSPPELDFLPGNSRPTCRSVSTKCSSPSWWRSRGARSKPVAGRQRSRASVISRR